MGIKFIKKNNKVRAIKKKVNKLFSSDYKRLTP